MDVLLYKFGYTADKSPKDLTAGVEILTADDILTANEPVDIYSADGKLVIKNQRLSEARRTLPPGIYIINGIKILL